MRRILFVLLSSGLLSLLGAGTINDRFSWSMSDLTLEPRDGFAEVRVERCSPVEPVGSPMLPCRLVRYLIPPDAVVTSIEVTAEDTVDIPLENDLYPVQPPQPIGFAEPEFVPPDPVVYESQFPYPAVIARCLDCGGMAGYRIATIALYPVQWLPQERKLRFFPRVRVRVNYELAQAQAQAQARSRKQTELFEPIVMGMVKNPGKVKTWRPEVTRRATAVLPPGSFDFVIVTDSARFGSALESLAYWKDRKGIRTRIADVSLANAYPGRDQAERLRGFVADAAETWGATYFLLAGDYDVVPVRNCYVVKTLPDSSPNKWFDTIPADLYFSDLDGTWDRNGNNVFGEMADSVDGYPDVFVGRLCLSSVKNCSTAVEKILRYERVECGHQVGNLRKLLLPNEFGPWATDTVARLAPSGMLKAKLYRSDIPAQEIVDSLNAGAHLVFELAHGGPCNLGRLYTSHAGLLSNGDILPVYVAQSCLSGRFDCERFRPDWPDCLAESLVNCVQAGPVASLMNTSYGWIGDDRHFAEFFASVFARDIGLGGSLAEAKARTRSPNPYGYADLYSFNLFGDPTMTVWTGVPGTPSVLFPSTVWVGASMRVSVRCETIPVRDAVVALSRPGELIVRGSTNASGAVVLSVPPSLAPGAVQLTVTGRNIVPFEGQCAVLKNPAAFLAYRTHTVDDSSGNQDGRLDPGESVKLLVTVGNVGESTAVNATAELCCSDPWLRIDVGSEELGTIVPGGLDTALFAVSLDSASPSGRYLPFELCFRFNEAGACTSWFSVIVSLHAVIDVHPDTVLAPRSGDYFIGDTIYPRCVVGNSGLLDASNVYVMFRLDSGAVQVELIPRLAGGETRVVPFARFIPLLGQHSYVLYTTTQGDRFRWNDTITGGFRVLGPTRYPGWRELRPVPADGRFVRYGGWLASDGISLYATKGRKTYSFYSYSPGKDSWRYRGQVPDKEEGKDKLPGRGCTAVGDGQGHVYMAKGNNTLGFWRFDGAAGTWSRLAGVPLGPNKKKVKGGSDLAYVERNGIGYVYLLKGCKTEFYRYNTTNPRWDTLPNVPYGGKEKYYKGSFLVYDGENTLYAHQARYNDEQYHYMFKYDITAGTWQAAPVKGMPLLGRHGSKLKTKKSGDGACGVWYDGGMFALKGGNTQQFFRFSPTADTWVELDTFPSNGSTGEKKRVKDGADLVNSGYGVLYALKGNKTNEFWSFALSESSSAQAEVAGMPARRSWSLAVRPNPSSGRAVVAVSLVRPGLVRLSVYDAGGRLVSRLASRRLDAGEHRFTWRPTGIAAGVYVVRLDVDGVTISRRLVLSR